MSPHKPVLLLCSFRCHSVVGAQKLFPSRFSDGSCKALLFTQSLGVRDPKWIKPSHILNQ